jgi:hypothetical protein
MQEFFHSLSYLIYVFPNHVSSSTQMHDLLLMNVNS